MLSLLIAGFIYYIYTARKKEFAYKTNLEKAKAREQERIDIAANLHDKVVGDLRMIHDKTLKINADEISKPLHKVYQEIRNVSHKLSSVDFDEVSFKDQIINLVTDYFEIYLPIYSNLGWEIGQPDYDQKIRFKFTVDPQALLGLFRRRWF